MPHAHWMARAHCALRPDLTQLQVWGRNPDASAALAAMLAQEGLPATTCDDLEASVRAGAIINCATTSTTPLVRGAWLQPGTHLDLVVGFKPDMRETDDAAIQMDRICVDTYTGALSERATCCSSCNQGSIDRTHVRADLAQPVARSSYEQSEGDITVFSRWARRWKTSQRRNWSGNRRTDALLPIRTTFNTCAATTRPSRSANVSFACSASIRQTPTAIRHVARVHRCHGAPPARARLR